MRLPWLSGLLLVLLGCAADSSRSSLGGRGPGIDGLVGESLRVHGGPASALEEGAVFLPVKLEEPGLEGWSAEALRAAGYRVEVVEFENVPEPAWHPESGIGTDELLSRRPPRRGRQGGPIGGLQTGVTYRIPTAYHKMITRAFRKEWGYDKRSPPNPQERLELMLKVYSRYPIPQLIGINP